MRIAQNSARGNNLSCTKFTRLIYLLTHTMHQKQEFSKNKHY